MYSRSVKRYTEMSQASTSPNGPREVFNAYREGQISEERAKCYFGEDWEEVKQLDRVENILENQPESDVDDSELFR